MFKIDTEEIKQLESDLKTFKERAYPFATKNTVNQAAFKTQKRMKIFMHNNMILRNKFSESSIRVETTKTLRVSAQAAVVGSIAPYMENQEFGATIIKKGKHGVPIPTSEASGEGRGVKTRRKVVPRSRSLRSIKLNKSKIRTKSKKQENFIRIQQAIASGRKFVFLDLQKHPGIYRMSGGKKAPKINLIHDMSRKSVSIPKNPTLLPATRVTQKELPSIYRKSLIFQLKRHKLFKG